MVSTVRDDGRDHETHNISNSFRGSIMTPARAASRVGTLIDRLATELEKEKGFPKPENLGKFNGLISQYSQLLKVSKSREQGQPDADQSPSRDGLPGAYEKLFEE